LSHDLFEAARKAVAFSHSPYSKFPVGAAVRTDTGQVYIGANCENLSFPEGWCAETTALGQMVMGGDKHVAEVAIFAPKLALCAPCGGCRQRLAEFSTGSTKVWLCDETGPQKMLTMAELLPAAFETDAF
jgi:cytidine deaminase